MKIGDEVVGPIKAAWHRFLERTETVRPELFLYCRSLTGSVWDAEDLVQDTLMRAFARLSEASQPIENARAYLFRIASNLWIDRFRGTREFASEQALDPAAPADENPPAYAIRDAARHLFIRLPPMERAAVLLKDVFDLSLDETATALDTTSGAVKSALHRARARLGRISSEPAAVAALRPAPHDNLLERFVEAFNARDVGGLAAITREDATSEMVGMSIEYGRDEIRKSKTSVISHTFASYPNSDDFKAELREHDGERIIVFWAREKEGIFVRSILKTEEREGAISRLRYYFFCPETLSEVCAAIGVPVRTNGYRPSWT